MSPSPKKENLPGGQTTSSDEGSKTRTGASNNKKSVSKPGDARDKTVRELSFSHLSARQIQDLRQKEIERERRQSAGKYGEMESRATSRVVTPLHILDKQLKEQERRRSSSASVTGPGAHYSVGSLDQPQKLPGVDKNPLQESPPPIAHSSAPLSRRTSDSSEPVGSSASTSTSTPQPLPINRAPTLPGAFAQDGPGNSDTLCREDSAVNEVLASLARASSEAAGSEMAAPEDALEAGVMSAVPSTRGISNHQSMEASSKRSLGQRHNSLVKAQMVDDAEAIFYAEDAVVDNFQRKLIVGLVVAVVICVVAVSLALSLRPVEDDPPACELDDICCVDWDEVAYPRVIPLSCYCFNTIQAIYEEMGPLDLVIYEQFKRNFVSWQLIGQDEADALDPSGCHPYNQAALAISQPAKLNLTFQELADIPPSVARDLLAQFVLFASTGGVKWVQSEGWYERVQVCSYFGVDCIFADTIAGLALPQNGLIGSLPTEIGLIRSLRELDLSGNSDLTGLLPTELAGLGSLTSLDLSKLEIGGAIPTFFGVMTSLQTLNLGSSNFSGTIPWVTFQLTAANFLSLANNKLSGSLPSEFGRLTGLDILRLNLNELTGTLPSEMSNMENLGLLHIGGNRLTGKIPAFLGRMPKLKLLDIYQSGLTGSIPESFCRDTSNSTSSGQDGGLLLEASKQIVLDCSLIDPCSCCSVNGSRGVRMICGNQRPEDAIGNGERV